MALRKYSFFIGLFFTVTTITLMSFGIFTLNQRPFEFELLYSYAVLGLVHGVIALGFAYFKKGVGLSIYFLGYASGFYILLTGLSRPNEGFLQLANLFMAFTLTIIGIFVGIIVELLIWIARKKKKPEDDPHLS
jgi:hypothetical protein